MPSDEDYLRRAIRLAMDGRGRVEPNPMVGCVIVKDDRVIGEGHHQQFSHPHAEPNALASCTESPQGATAYVTLEPCCHLNKQTPPCVPQLIQAKIARVVYGCTDPNPDVSGNGLKSLREAGIAVDGPVLEKQCKQLIAPFAVRIARHRPYYTLKWAQTADGKIAGPGGKRMRISGDAANRAVHQLRSNCGAIVVGINTVLRDDPLLTARGTTNGKTPVRFVMDHHLQIPESSQLVQTVKFGAVVVVCELSAVSDRKYKRLEALGIKFCPIDDLSRLHEGMLAYGVTHALVEAGPTLARSFFDQNLADRLWLIESPHRADDPSAVPATAVPNHFVQVGETMLGGDRLREFLNPRSEAFFTAEPSADLVLTGAA